MSVPRFKKSKKRDEKTDSNSRHKETAAPRYASAKPDSKKSTKPARGIEHKRFKRFNPSGPDRNSEKSVKSNIRNLRDSINTDKENLIKEKDEYKKEIESQLTELNAFDEEQRQMQLAIERRRLRNSALKRETNESGPNDDKNEPNPEKPPESAISENGPPKNKPNAIKNAISENGPNAIKNAISENGPDAPKNAISEPPAPKSPENMFNLASPPPAALETAARPPSEPPAEPPATALAPADDADGFYAFRAGDLLHGRYKALRFKGTGVFSSVFLVADAADGRRRCVKVARSLDAMRQTALREAVLLRKLQSRPGAAEAHCVRFFDSFEHRGHVCLVFEELSGSLRQVLRGGGVGLAATRRYAAQLCAALAFVREAGLVHADVKPDNVLVSESRAEVKLCDFGSAFDARSCSVTPYLCSRYYRPPEIILGCPYGPPVDMWSLGCVVFELFTGRILFNGATNNAMLRLFFDLLGPPPKKLLRHAAFAAQHFTADGAFLSAKTDPVTGAEYRAPVAFGRMKKQELSKELLSALPAASAAERKAVRELSDFLGRCLKMDPEKRICPKAALVHPFLAPGSK